VRITGAGNFRDDSTELAVARGFLEAGEDGFVISRLDVDDPVRRESSLRYRRGEQILAGLAP
jgi:hypothetical protein